MWFFLVIAAAVAVAILIPAALFDRRRRRAGREPGDHLHADTKRLEILSDAPTVIAEATNRDHAGGGGHF